MKIFSQYKLGDIVLNNRLVMAPMTRSRAIDNIPNDLMVEYYRLRATAGLIITEGVAPSANGLGYPRIPGIYSQAQIEGWKKVTDAVHAEGGKIFIQLMHTGRVSHPDNMDPNTRVLAPSAIGMSGGMWTDTKGKQAFPEPLEMTLRDIEQAQEEHVEGAKNAMEAGFDGIELHGANGYLIDQFINTASNKRQDEYGGSTENRCRFALKKEKGTLPLFIRHTPYSQFGRLADLRPSIAPLGDVMGIKGSVPFSFSPFPFGYFVKKIRMVCSHGELSGVVQGKRRDRTTNMVSPDQPAQDMFTNCTGRLKSYQGN